MALSKEMTKTERQAQQAQQAQQFGTSVMQQGHSQLSGWVTPAKRDEYANQITIERREHDAVLRFHLRGEDYSTLVREITVPLGALEGLT